MKRLRDDVQPEPQPQKRRTEVSSRGETNKQPKTLDALTYLKSVKEIFHDNKEKYESFLELMKDFKAQRIDTEGVIERIKELFKGYKDLLLGFNTFLPKGYKITLQPEEEKPKVRVDFKDAIGFVTKINTRFGDDERAYKSFLDILNMYRKERKSISEVYKEVTMLFKGHEDLLMEFVNFLPNCPESAPSAKKAVQRHKGTETSDKKLKLRCKLEDNSEHSDQREDGDENLVACSPDSLVKEGHPGDFQDDENREDTETDTADRTEKSAASGSKDIGNHKPTTPYVGTPINELDLSECTQCTPSYRLLPKDYAVEIPSYRNTLGKKTLNDHLVSVTSGSEDYSFSHMRKNQYEESLFRCEDDRYEMDMLLGSVSSAITHVESLLEKMNNNTISVDTNICIEKHLSAMNLRCIERLYGDNGLDVMDLLKKNMHSALPVILTRLKQKQEEWARCHSDFQKVWAEVYAKNHHKSLDHRSFYFKQQDSKNLSTKCLVAEIKDISEKRHQEDLLQAIAVRTMPSFTPDLEFDYCDTQIHEDLYLLIKYYCEEICATEQSDKVMKLWITFLEPMFGTLSRSQGDLATEDVSKLKNNQELHDACVAVKDSSSGSKGKHPISPKLLKDNPTMQGSSPGKDVSANIMKAAQHDKLQDDTDMSYEVIQSTKLVSARNDQIMEDVSVVNHEAEREEGELSPTNSCEQGNFDVSGQNGLKPLQRVMDNVTSNTYQQSCDKKGAYCTETGTKGNTHPEDDENCHKLSEDNETASEKVASGTKSGCHEKHKEPISVAGEVANGKEGEDGSFAFTERFLQTVKPVAKHMLYERIQSAKKHSEKKWKAPDNTTPDSYPRFIDALYNLLDGSSDNTKFEDECRAIFGAQSYVLFTLDKLVQKFVKHLHAVAADETDTKLRQLHAYENYRKLGRFVDLVYHENARALLHEANIYRIRYSSAKTRLSIQLMNCGNNQPEVAGVAMEPDFANYLQKKFLTSVNDDENHGLFLKRNKEKFTNVNESSGDTIAMEGLSIINEIECKMACSSSKVKYVANTSDLLYRNKQGKQNSKGPRLKRVSEISKQRRILRFHIMLNCKLCALPPI
ncbi:PREDICTED: paired amphipathic helix protein Sin3-like 6 [Camelina sativa]|uniref:Paired amphipathic helix protein Sin3-like 6 n=1 Tax=Camelina sativa TaxID=90675 RepID=A0ABM0VXN8_CAMSA|nr:PREDICTED: paired amphipathic helix protein Sin3-like 6 [Camelina sativa]